MPSRELHLLAGASGAGKSRFKVQLGMSLTQGEPFLGLIPTRPWKVAFVSCDRGGDSFQRLLREELHLPEDIFPWFAEEAIPLESGRVGSNRPSQVLRWVKSQSPESELIILDGFSGLCPKANDYWEVRAMERDLQKTLRALDQTALGSVHAAKLRPRDKVLNPRERVLGSVAWAAGAELVISLDSEDPEKVDCPFRVASFSSHSGPPFRLRLRFGADGRLIECGSEEEKWEILDKLLLPRWPEGGWSRREVHEASELLPWEGEGPSERSLDRWLSSRAETGILEKEGTGRTTKFVLSFSPSLP